MAFAGLLGVLALVACSFDTSGTSIRDVRGSDGTPDLPNDTPAELQDAAMEALEASIDGALDADSAVDADSSALDITPEAPAEQGVDTMVDTVPPVDAGPTQIKLTRVFPNLPLFSRAVDFQAPNDGTNKIYVVEQQGIIYSFDNQPNVSQRQVFLDIRSIVHSYADPGGFNEQGLLGLAFHPSYQSNGFFFVNFTTPTKTHVVRYRRSTTNPQIADPNSATLFLQIGQPAGNHNGGGLAFGPTDGLLYITMGDGGGAGDPNNLGQSLKTLLGKILRVNVDTPSGGRNYGIPSGNPFVSTSGAAPEIWAYGLRNTWRFSFDIVTGKMWGGDVGQNKFEEINVIEAGRNYGWSIVEGNECFSLTPPAPPCNKTGLTPPLIVHDHTEAGSITGGYVYRGTQIPQLYGWYIYGDFFYGRIWIVDPSQTPLSPIKIVDQNSLVNYSTFGVDAQNELYVVGFDGKLYKFGSAP